MLRNPPVSTSFHELSSGVGAVRGREALQGLLDFISEVGEMLMQAVERVALRAIVARSRIKAASAASLRSFSIGSGAGLSERNQHEAQDDLGQRGSTT